MAMDQKNIDNTRVRFGREKNLDFLKRFSFSLVQIISSCINLQVQKLICVMLV
jgi:hypothetical protein